MKLPKFYDPSAYEPTIYGLWEASGAFKPTGQGKPYSIAMPPPNANGNLHLGHALTIGLQDILIRYHRMIGDDTIYIPGADHAGFETWTVYEKQLVSEGKSRFDFSREQLYKQVWDFVEARRGDMELQTRALGASASWDDLVFTLDEKVISTVYETFRRLWDDKLIYRGERIVNFCTYHQTGFADIEVEHRDEKSKLWEIAYPLLDQVGELIVATTRPETLLGDTAIAVHPEDSRYQHLIGKHVQVPLVRREIPIIADEHVDPKFGTGAVKVTPAHDPNDFEIGQRHDLPSIEVIGTDGALVDTMPASYRGLDIKAARAKIITDLEIEELLRGEKELVHSVGHCYKCGTVLEPLLKDQWFLRIQPLAERAIAAIKSGDVTVHPESKSHTVIQYLENVHDWNLSRQIAWGIPIPAFQNTADENDWIFDTRVEEPLIQMNGNTYRREEDTFDTWFSSSQWPFVTTDYLSSGELNRFYPTEMMETGHDILFWVARMLMLGLYATDKVPFNTVYMHGLVLDEKGQKMSKSKGNVISPMDLIDKYGSDALRLGVITSRSAGQNQAFATEKVIASRNFCNKLWNIARFIESQLDENTPREANSISLADHWVLQRLDAARERLEKDLDEYKFADAADTIYHTIWDDVADWYIEASKVAPNPSMMGYVLETVLKLAHPFVPFVTEAIWTTLNWDKTPLIQSSWPGKITYNDIAAAEFEQLKALVAETRFVANELPGNKQTLLFQNDQLIADNAELIRRLAGLAAVTQADQASGLRLAVPNREAWLEMSADTLYEHQSKLETRLAECRELVHKLQTRLNNKSYVDHAPAAVVNETRDQLSEQLELEKRLERELQVLSHETPDLV